MDIIKAIIPAGGMGTRFLPYTKTIPKEMLPILNKPAIQCIVEEGLQSKVNNFLVVTSRAKHSISDHFEQDVQFKQYLKERNLSVPLDNLNNICNKASLAYIPQHEPLGLGHAILSARHHIGKEYIGIMLPDEIIMHRTPALEQIIKVAKQEQASVVAVCEVPTHLLSSYGIIGIKKQISTNLFQVSHIVEKPHPKDAPSALAIVGRYVLSHKIFPALEQTELDERGEIQLTQGICRMMHANEKVFAYKIQGVRYDIGNPIGWVKAVIGCALQDPHFSPHIRAFLGDQENMENYACNPMHIADTF